MRKGNSFSGLFVLSGCFLAVSQIAMMSFPTEKKDSSYSYSDSGDGSNMPPHHATSNTSLAQFYTRLIKNYPYNYKGSCGYVALCSYLSYFDAFYSDMLIPESMDAISSTTTINLFNGPDGSPGVKEDEMIAPDGSAYSQYDGGKFSTSEYWSAEMSRVTTSLQASLLSIGMTMGYISATKIASNSSSCFGIFPSELENVATQFLSSYDSLTEGTSFSIEGVEDQTSPTDNVIGQFNEEVTSFAVEKIDSGYPVILFEGGFIGGHVAIAYDYFTQNGETTLLCHDGRKAKAMTQCLTPTEEGTLSLDAAFCINFSLPFTKQKKSNNCLYESSNGLITQHSPLLGDGSPVRQYPLDGVDVSTHSCLFQALNDSAHGNRCSCGVDSNEEEHAYVLRSINGHPYNICSVCGHSIDLDDGKKHRT